MPKASLLLPADPKANYAAHQEEIDMAIRGVLERGWYILGQEVAAFEQEFARYLGADHAIGVGSGTEAIHLALRVCGIGPGDVVLTASHTAVATVAAIELAGAAPLLVDVDPLFYTIDPNRLEEAIKKWAGTGRLAAIIPVHLYGHPADMPAIMDIAQRHNLYVIEDCAQSHGATFRGRKTGRWGHLAAFSFYPTKNLGALGDGGAVVTDNPDLAERARSLREYGWRQRYVSDHPGMNTRLDELQAAILRVKLRYLDQENARRRELAQIYDTCLSALGAGLLTPPPRQAVAEHVYHLYVIRVGPGSPRAGRGSPDPAVKQRELLQAFLKEHAVGTAIHYPLPVHLQPAYRSRVAVGQGGLAETERACETILSLPMHPHLTDGQVQHVCDTIARWATQST